jgi:hypothetical protein
MKDFLDSGPKWSTGVKAASRTVTKPLRSTVTRLRKEQGEELELEVDSSYGS